MQRTTKHKISTVGSLSTLYTFPSGLILSCPKGVQRLTLKPFMNVALDNYAATAMPYISRPEMARIVQKFRQGRKKELASA